MRGVLQAALLNLVATSVRYERDDPLLIRGLDVQLLLESSKGVSRSVMQNSAGTIHHAAAVGDVAQIRRLLEQGVKV